MPFSDEEVGFGMGFKIEGKTMARIYRNIWLPFVAPKRRFLLLALAAYIALC